MARMGISWPLYAVVLLITVNVEIEYGWNALMATVVDALILLAAGVSGVNNILVCLPFNFC